MDFPIRFQPHRIRLYLAEKETHALIFLLTFSFLCAACGNSHRFWRAIVGNYKILFGELEEKKKKIAMINLLDKDFIWLGAKTKHKNWLMICLLHHRKHIHCVRVIFFCAYERRRFARGVCAKYGLKNQNERTIVFILVNGTLIRLSWGWSSFW